MSSASLGAAVAAIAERAAADDGEAADVDAAVHTW